MRYPRKVISKLKPPWLSWFGLLGLVIQCILALLLIYRMVGIRWGLYKVSIRTPFSSDVYPVLFLIGGLLALGLAVAIYRNRWWGYISEAILLWAMHIVGVSDHMARYWANPVRIERVWWEKELNTWLFVAFVWLTYGLIKRGIRVYRENHPRQTMDLMQTEDLHG